MVIYALFTSKCRSRFTGGTEGDTFEPPNRSLAGHRRTPVGVLDGIGGGVGGRDDGFTGGVQHALHLWQPAALVVSGVGLRHHSSTLQDSGDGYSETSGS